MLIDDDGQTGTNPLHLAAELTAAWLGNHFTRAKAEEVPAFLRAVHATMVELRGDDRPAAAEPVQAAAEHTPAVSVRKSLASPDHIISMIDGRRYRTLKRHLSTNGLTPDQYRERYGLKPDYPMVAPGYSADRSATAKRLGLGRKPAMDDAVIDDAAANQDDEVVEVTAPVEQDETPEQAPRQKLKLRSPAEDA